MAREFVSGSRGFESSPKSLEQVILEVRRSIAMKCERKERVLQVKLRLQEAADKRFRDEALGAEDWYREHTQKERLQAAKASKKKRRNHGLSEDQLLLPF